MKQVPFLRLRAGVLLRAAGLTLWLGALAACAQAPSPDGGTAPPETGLHTFTLEHDGRARRCGRNGTADPNLPCDGGLIGNPPPPGFRGGRLTR